MQSKQQLIDFLLTHLTDTRAQKIKDKSILRTNYITVVLEDIFQSHNMSAAIRSCEGFGLQNVHIIEDRNKYVVNQKVVKGAADWVDITRYKHAQLFETLENLDSQNPEENLINNSGSIKKANYETNFENTKLCFEKLRAQGYRIVATTPHEKDKLIYDLPLETGKIALVFGTEETGLSKYAMENADEYVKIPMYGFTESFNISVSVAICLYELTKRLRASRINWQLTEEEVLDLQLNWLKRCLPYFDLLKKEFDKNNFYK